MVMPSEMLPPNATPLERAIADTAPRQILDTLAEAPRRLKSSLPDTVVPWLAAEWFLADFAGYFPDPRALIAAGLPWLKVRGTAAAVKQALAWIGMTAALEEEGAHLQIDPGTAAAPSYLADIRRLVGASIPAHVRLYRLYHGYDLRRTRLDASILDAAQIDDDSGIWCDGVKLSFGVRAAALIDAGDIAVASDMTRHYSMRVWDDNSWRLDAWALDSEILLDVAGGMVNQQSATVVAGAEDAIAGGRTDRHALTLAADSAAIALSGRTDGCACALPSATRGWTGSWTGHWREPIPTRTTFEDA